MKRVVLVLEGYDHELAEPIEPKLGSLWRESVTLDHMPTTIKATLLEKEEDECPYHYWRRNVGEFNRAWLKALDIFWVSNHVIVYSSFCKLGEGIVTIEDICGVLLKLPFIFGFENDKELIILSSSDFLAWS